jgi:hypothetical protein
MVEKIPRVWFAQEHIDCIRLRLERRIVRDPLVDLLGHRKSELREIEGDVGDKEFFIGVVRVECSSKQRREFRIRSDTEMRLHH